MVYQKYKCDVYKNMVDKKNIHESFYIPVIRTCNDTDGMPEKEHYDTAVLDICDNCMEKIVKIKCGCRNSDIEWLNKETNNSLKVGYKDDEIFLLSVEEYNKYRDKISHIPVLWWLRSPGYDQDDATFVYNHGDVSYSGSIVRRIDSAVRPALKFESNQDTIYVYGTTWDKIDDNLYIARMPITFMEFDEKYNDYETSEVRKFLLDFVR